MWEEAVMNADNDTKGRYNHSDENIVRIQSST